MDNSTDIDSILLANWYSINCRKCGNAKKETARKYLTMKINKALSERKRKHPDKASSFLKFF